MWMAFRSKNCLSVSCDIAIGFTPNSPFASRLFFLLQIFHYKTLIKVHAIEKEESVKTIMKIFFDEGP